MEGPREGEKDRGTEKWRGAGREGGREGRREGGGDGGITVKIDNVLTCCTALVMSSGGSSSVPTSNTKSALAASASAAPSAAGLLSPSTPSVEGEVGVEVDAGEAAVASSGWPSCSLVSTHRRAHSRARLRGTGGRGGRDRNTGEGEETATRTFKHADMQIDKAGSRCDPWCEAQDTDGGWRTKMVAGGQRRLFPPEKQQGYCQR